MTRIAVIGSPGAGKSTLARHLGAALGIEVFHLDRLFWQPGWVEMPRPDWAALQQQLVEGENWIIDGNYGGTMQIRLQRAEVVVFLDFPRWVCLWGALKRRIQYAGRTRPDLSPGCPERLDLAFLRFIWEFPEKGGRSVEARLAQLSPEVSVFRLHSRRQVAEFLRTVHKTGETPRR